MSARVRSSPRAGLMTTTAAGAQHAEERRHVGGPVAQEDPDLRGRYVERLDGAGRVAASCRHVDQWPSNSSAAASGSDSSTSAMRRLSA